MRIKIPQEIACPWLPRDVKRSLTVYHIRDGLQEFCLINYYVFGVQITSYL